MHSQENIDMTPDNDPNMLQQMVAFLGDLGPQTKAACLSFFIAFLRALYTGGGFTRSLIEAALCGCLTLAIVPVLAHWGLSAELSISVGAAGAFLGVEWMRDRVAAIADKVLKKWFAK
ncbi:phage holin, lambda family [Carnimonas bestiolae]|uniref:phage holin, lambda family n=1 Tax=Carnimonas bestiolae TaxID=3402172 RepID=UPI003EDC0E32